MEPNMSIPPSQLRVSDRVSNRVSDRLSDSISHKRNSSSQPNADTTTYISICFPTESDTTFRLSTFIDEPVRIPDYIANYIKNRGLPFEVSVYDRDPTHMASFFFLPNAFEKVEEYARRQARNRHGIESYEITPHYQQDPKRRGMRYYDLWIEYIPDGTPLSIRVVCNE
jgi:hypothetical protein